MNAYFEVNRHLTEHSLAEASPIEFAPVAAVPKIPLQKAVGHIKRDEQVAATSSSSRSISSHDNTSDLSATMPQTQKEITDLRLKQQNLCPKFHTNSVKGVELWCMTAQKGIRIKFIHLVEFLENQSSILLHAVFGDIKDHSSAKNIVMKPIASSSKALKKSFATTVTSPEEQWPSQPSVLFHQDNAQAGVLPICNFCRKSHSVIDCQRFASKSNDIKVEHLKKNGHCFG